MKISVLLSVFLFSCKIGAASVAASTAESEAMLRLLSSKVARRYLANEYGEETCDYENNQIVCKICDNGMCLNEVCVLDNNMQSMDCNVCITYEDNGGEAFQEFCLDLICNAESYQSESTEEACYCAGASVDGDACSMCSFCPTDSNSYDVFEGIKTGKPYAGLGLQCGNHADINKTCPVSKSDTLAKVGLVIGAIGVAVALCAVLALMQKPTNDAQKFTLMEDGKGNNSARPLA